MREPGRRRRQGDPAAGLRGRRLAAIALAAGACVSIAGSARAAVAQAPFEAYDRAGVTHDEQCIATSAGVRVRVLDLEGDQLRTVAGAVSDPPEARETCAGSAGVRVQGIEALPDGAESMYYTWPFERGGQAPGLIAASELASAPALDAAAAAGNGAPAPAAPGEPAYALTPRDIAPEQRYAGPTTPRWYTYSVYGRPVGGAQFALMSWSWVDVAGGGIARAALAEGELFFPADVQAISLPSAAGAGQPANGTVTARYGYALDSGRRVYGWIVTSHTFEGLCFDHVTYVGGGPPLPGTLCPEGGLADSIADGAGWSGAGLG